MSLTGYLLNSLWQFPVAVLATWVLVHVLARRDPLLRYKLWLACLILSVILPACPRPALSHFVPLHVQSTTQTLPVSDSAHSISPKVNRTAAACIEVLSWTFFVAAFFGCCRLTSGLVGLHRLLQTSMPAALSSDIALRYENVAKELGLSSSPGLRVHARVSSPATAGWKEPVILLPKAFPSWSGDKLLPALSHELMHISRNDFFWNIASRVLLLPLLYNPLSWWLHRQIELAREMVCDEMAASLSGDRQAYAESLLSMGRSSYHSRHGLALNWFTKQPLEERIMRLLSSTDGKQPTRWSLPLGMIALSGLAVTLTLGSSFAAHAQAQTPSSAATPSAPVAGATARSAQEPLAIAKGAHAHANKQRGTFEHQWKAADGDNVVILTQSPEPPSAGERERVEKTLRDNKLVLGSLPALLHDTESKLTSSEIDLQIHKAELALSDANFNKQMAEFQRLMKDGSLQRSMKQAEDALKNFNKQ